ncbi:MAG: outer membrane beta-barrel protein [Hasllibacter sp.]
MKRMMLLATILAGGAQAQSAIDGAYVGAFVAATEYEGGGPDLDGQRLGFSIGRNNVAPSGLYTGFEFSAAFSNVEGGEEILPGVPLSIEEGYEIAATLRLGYAFGGRGAVYGKASARRASFDLFAGGASVEDDAGGALGLGVGVEYALGNGFGIALEYDRFDYETAGAGDREGSSLSIGIRRGF